MNPAPQGP